MPDINDWPALVTFSDNPASNHTQRSQYRAGKLPSARKMIEWARAHGLRFTIDADGVRAERVRAADDSRPCDSR
jgi:bifunctional ADP-heptose synthase (sugar kinase/adenylyltransferase)